jgi:hypothetical protein
MSAEIIQIRDFQNKRDLATITEAISTVLSGDPVPVGMEPVIHIPFGGQGIDGMWTDTSPSEMNPDKPA